MNDLNQASLDLHRKHRGKFEINSKVPLENKGDLSLAYTPGVGAVSKALHENPALMYELTPKGNMVAVISDGSAVLGLGNVGPAAAYPVMEGKCLLFKRFAGVDAIPLILETQDTEEIIEMVSKLAINFGGINLEDIASPRCFEIEEALKVRLKIPVFHDDQHGTAIVVLAGLLNALKVVEKDKSVKVVINGAGAAGISIAKLLHQAGFPQLILVDTAGALYKGRSEHMNSAKEEIVHHTNPNLEKGSLTEIVKEADVLIGVSQAGLFNKEMIQSMATNPVVFALANPVPEIMPDLAKEAGAAVIATGRSDFPNQLNNVLAFPGVFRGALDA
ncbi:MAG: NADP-dependent malic enzyme, partial [Patescibacteria group bacterium]